MPSLGRILILDDEEFDHMVYERIFRRVGISENMIAIQDPRDALAILADGKSADIQLIMLDVNMPRMSGLDFLDAIEPILRKSGIPVIMMLTTPLSPNLKARAAKHDAIVDYFMKPIRPDHVARAVDILERRIRATKGSDAA